MSTATAMKPVVIETVRAPAKETTEPPRSTLEVNSRDAGMHAAEVVSLDPAISPEMVAGIPSLMIDQYVEAAVRHAVVREVDPGVWVAKVVGLGAWVDADSSDEAEADFPGAVRSWVVSKLSLGARDLPVLDGIDLNPRESE